MHLIYIYIHHACLVRYSHNSYPSRPKEFILILIDVHTGTYNKVPKISLFNELLFVVIGLVRNTNGFITAAYPIIPGSL